MGRTLTQIKDTQEEIAKEVILFPVFGDSGVAERLVEWGERAKLGVAFGKKSANPKMTTPWGLVLEAGLNDDGNVAVKLRLTPKQLREFITTNFKRPSLLHFADHGVAVTGPFNEGYFISIRGGADGSIKLATIPLKAAEDEVECAFLGAIHITEAGFFLEQVKERQDVIVEADPLTMTA